MTAVREFLNGEKSRWITWGLLAVAAIALPLSIRSFLSDSEAAQASSERLYICTETGKTFEHEPTVGETTPVESPYSGKKTGYRAELCFWTADGSVKEEPTALVLNEIVGKPGRTFCPDCGRLVRPHNPRPNPGDTPPPKQSEIKSSKERNFDERS